MSHFQAKNPTFSKILSRFQVLIGWQVCIHLKADNNFIIESPLIVFGENPVHVVAQLLCTQSIEPGVPEP